MTIPTPPTTESSPDPADHDPPGLTEHLVSLQQASSEVATLDQVLSTLREVRERMGNCAVLYTEFLFGETALRVKQARLEGALVPSPVVYERDRLWVLALLWSLRAPAADTLNTVLRTLSRLAPRVPVGRATPPEQVALARQDVLAAFPRDQVGIRELDAAVTTYGGRVRDWVLGEVARHYRDARQAGYDPELALHQALAETRDNVS